MNAFSDELRNERESRNITLAEIARKTRINVKYLEALEQGSFDVLPQTYIRAFVKSYAEAVGVSAEQLLHRYDVIVSQKYSGQQPDRTESLPSPLTPTKEKDSVIEKEKKTRLVFVVVVGFIVTIVIGFYLFDSFSSTFAPHSVPETSFQEVLKEQEKQPVALTIDSVDTTKVFVQKEPDSLVLRAISLDSVWITITRDSLPPRSGYMLKGRYRTYFAKREFLISLSDAGAIKLLLNGKELEPLGAKGERIRNKKITHEHLQR
jgi:cytoskeletal protein RodZ